jgi:hypothetical protein
MVHIIEYCRVLQENEKIMFLLVVKSCAGSTFFLRIRLNKWVRMLKLEQALAKAILVNYATPCLGLLGFTSGLSSGGGVTYHDYTAENKLLHKQRAR